MFAERPGGNHGNIPQMNPSAANHALAKDINEAVRRVLGSGQYILGQEVASFELEFAGWLGGGHAVGCASGTDALALALRAFGIGPGSAVVTASHTAVATVAAIEMAGATPLLIDIEAGHFTLDARELAALLANPPPNCPPIRAVIPVHIYGQAADMGPILELSAAHGLVVIEDCAQAHGASYLRRRVGTLGDAAAFSFYPTKNLGALGDGGLVSFRDKHIAERARSLRQYGWGKRFVSEEPGINSRLDEIQAAILRVKLAHLDRSNDRRAAIAAAYDDAMAALPMAPPLRRKDCRHVFHQYVVRVGHRDSFQARLREYGIATGIHYPVPVHEQPAYAARVPLGPSACRTTSVVVQEIVSLPMYAELSDGQVERICAALVSTLRDDAFQTSHDYAC